MNNSFIQKLTCLVEANLANENFGPRDLAREAGISHSNLNRKLKSILNKNSSQFIREIRLKKAEELLSNEELTVAEISYRVGFGSPTYFSRCFHEFYGYAPGELRNHIPENEPEEQPVQPVSKKRNRTKILIGILAGLMVLIPFSIFLIKKGSKTAAVEKSIAVLAFVDDSPKGGNTYIINGLMEEILDKLQNIGGLKVKSRTDTELYRDTKKSVAEIAKELDVNYIIEGSGQVIDEKIKLSIQLIECSTGNHILSQIYTKDVKDIFTLQEEVALSVADELGAILTRDEKIQIAKKPTENPAAHNYYLRGIEYLKLHGSSHNWGELYKAKQNFEQAIQLDTTFAEAYVRLASIYINILADHNLTVSMTKYELWWQQSLDSGLMMANKALRFDEKNSEAYWLRGIYYEQTGLLDKAEEEFAKNAALENVSKRSSRYMEHFFRCYNNEDYLNALEYYFKYQEISTEERETERTMLHHVSYCFGYLGYLPLAKLYCQKFLNQYNDSLGYYQIMAVLERTMGNFESAEKFQLKCYEIDSTNILSLYCLLLDHVGNREYKTAHKYVIALEKEYLKSGRGIEPEILSGYIYFKIGDAEKADFHLNGSEQKLLKEIESNPINKQLYYSYWNLAKVYSIWGDKRKALDNLQMLKYRKTDYTFLPVYLNRYPFFDFIRDNPEFIEVLKDVEAKYNAEHDRAGKWLKEQGVL